jgi:hypothetical protein
VDDRSLGVIGCVLAHSAAVPHEQKFSPAATRFLIARTTKINTPNRRAYGERLRRRQCEAFIEPPSHAADHHLYWQAEPRKA